jgi:hypothetical protein
MIIMRIRVLQSLGKSYMGICKCLLLLICQAPVSLARLVLRQLATPYGSASMHHGGQRALLPSWTAPSGNATRVRARAARWCQRL